VPDALTDPNLKKLFDIGVAGLTLMVPFLAAYIGYSIADRSALAPAAIGAWVGASFGAGFSGRSSPACWAALSFSISKKIPVPKILRSVMPIFVIPIVGTLLTAGIMMWGLGEPVGAADYLAHPLAARDATRQHCGTRYHYGADAGLRHGRACE
jgi:fructose-like PTS system EIIC or EIIBC or EIIABC component